jgi:hypothetical protein
MNTESKQVEEMLNMIAESAYKVVEHEPERLDETLEKLKLELKRRALLFQKKNLK